MEIYERVNELLGSSYNSNNKIDWKMISSKQILSEDFIREFQDKVNWYKISEHQKLSEKFIRKFQNKVNWYYISRYQTLTEEFIREFQNKVDWKSISKYQKLNNSFVNEFKLNDIKGDNWLNKNIEYKKNEVIKTGVFETYDNYFVCFKVVKLNGKSLFYNGYYEVGKTYTAHADYTDKECSFGLNCADLNYCKRLMNINNKVIKCKVYYSDIARIIKTDSGYIIRTSKIEIIEEI